MEVLRTENMSKVYGDKKVVDNVNIHINSGDIYGFVGENGAGKTTVIRLVTGLIKLNGGKYFINGIENNDPMINKEKRKIAAIVERVSINSSMKALENMIVENLLFGSPKTNEELIDLINLVGLNYEDIKNKKIKDFSLGMKQRLGLALVMVQDPEIVLLDEPMNGVDPKGIFEIREAILRLNSKGVTFLISSHILSELEKICTRVGFISHGKIIEEIDMVDLRNKETIKNIVNTSNNDLLLNYIKEKYPNYSVTIDPDGVVINGDINLNEIYQFLIQSNVNILSANTIKETIEDYYLKVMGGKKND